MPRGTRPLAWSSVERDGVGTALLGEIAPSFPVSQKLDGGNRFQKLFELWKRELAAWGLQSMLGVKSNLGEVLGEVGM